LLALSIPLLIPNVKITIRKIHTKIVAEKTCQFQEYLPGSPILAKLLKEKFLTVINKD
jgi:hypothetical protein